MSEAIQGQTVALVDSIVTWLNAQDDAQTGNVDGSAFCLRLKAQRRFAILDDLTKLPKIGTPVQIDVFAGHEQEQRQGLSRVFLANYSVHILIQQFVGADTVAETQCALLMRLRSEIIDALKGIDQRVDDAVRPYFPAGLITISHGPEGPYDLTKLAATLCVFSSDTILTYKAVV